MQRVNRQESKVERKNKKGEIMNLETLVIDGLTDNDSKEDL